MKARIPGAQKGGQQAMLQRLQTMQEEIQKTQDEIEATDFTASAGGGAVEAVVTGAKEVREIKRTLKCCRIWSSLLSMKRSAKPMRL